MSHLSLPLYLIRVINIDVPSYNTEQEWSQFKQLGQTLQPQGIVLFYSLNDIETKMWVFEMTAPPQAAEASS